jgi:hypothetical protein
VSVRYYRAGPNDRWSGVVEMLNDVGYYYHPAWPLRSSLQRTLSSSERLEQLVNRGHWQPAWDIEGLQVEEGL